MMLCGVVWCGVVWCGEDRLSYNKLGRAGGAALAPALQKLTALQTLEYVRGRMAVCGETRCGLCVRWRSVAATPFGVCVVCRQRSGVLEESDRVRCNVSTWS